MATKVTYKGETLTTVRNDTKTLKTGGTWVEGDIGITDESGTAVVAVEDVPDSHGGIEKRITAVDISDTDATASDVAQGKVFYSNTGTRTTGTAVNAEWTTEGIARNTEPNGAITLKPWNKGNVYIFANNYAFHNKPITSVNFDFDNLMQQVHGGGECFAGSTLQTVTLTNYGANTSWKPESMFKNADKLLAFECPIPLDFGGYTQSFYQCKAMTRLSIPYGTGSMFAPCQNCNALEYADVGTADTLWASGFGNCYKLQTLILRKTAGVVTVQNVSAFNNTPMRGYNGLTGKIYVPQALISSYQTASNWSTLYAEGYCTFMPIEGSEYEL